MADDEEKQARSFLIAKTFIPKYYDILAKQPLSLHKFYHSESSHSSNFSSLIPTPSSTDNNVVGDVECDGDKDANQQVFTGPAIKETFERLAPYFKNSEIDISSGHLSSQMSSSSSVFILITGTICISKEVVVGSKPRGFTQSFLLEKDGGKYFVRNEVFVLFNAPEVVVDAVESKTVEPPAPVVAPEAVTPPVQAPKKERKSKHGNNEKRPIITPPKASGTEETKRNKPHTLANDSTDVVNVVVGEKKKDAVIVVAPVAPVPAVEQKPEKPSNWAQKITAKHQTSQQQADDLKIQLEQQRVNIPNPPNPPSAQSAAPAVATPAAEGDASPATTGKKSRGSRRSGRKSPDTSIENSNGDAVAASDAAVGVDAAPAAAAAPAVNANGGGFEGRRNGQAQGQQGPGRSYGGNNGNSNGNNNGARRNGGGNGNGMNGNMNGGNNGNANVSVAPPVVKKDDEEWIVKEGKKKNVTNNNNNSNGNSNGNGYNNNNSNGQNSQIRRNRGSGNGNVGGGNGGGQKAPQQPQQMQQPKQAETSTASSEAAPAVAGASANGGGGGGSSRNRGRNRGEKKDNGAVGAAGEKK